jgi:hypothetical protein
VIFPEWFPELAARADWLRPLERVRLAHNLVAGAAEMVLYETVWRRDRAGGLPCGHPLARPVARGDVPGPWRLTVGGGRGEGRRVFSRSGRLFATIP